MPTLIGSLPTVQEDDLELVNRILSQGESITESKHVLDDELKRIFSSKTPYLFNRGREALYFILKLFKLKPDDEVIVQAMTCVAVITPILWINAKPVYVDIKRDDFNIDIVDLEKKITSKTRAIIVQHTFGNIADVQKITEIAHRHNIFVIEDCAHLFYSDYENTPINKYSDAAFFSFAQDKSLSCTQGGLAIINDIKLSIEANTFYSSIQEQSNEQALYNAKYVNYWSKIKCYYFTPLFPFQNKITIGKALIIILRKLGLIKQQATKHLESYPTMHQISNIQSAMLVNQLRKLPTFEKHRIEIVTEYNKTLKSEYINRTSTPCLLRYPVLVKNPEVILEELRKQKYICGRWYSSIVFPLSLQNESTYYAKNSCPNAEFLIQAIINLPTDINTSREDAIGISKIVNEYGVPF